MTDKLTRRDLAKAAVGAAAGAAAVAIPSAAGERIPGSDTAYTVEPLSTERLCVAELDRLAAYAASCVTAIKAANERGDAYEVMKIAGELNHVGASVTHACERLAYHRHGPDLGLADDEADWSDTTLAWIQDQVERAKAS